MMDSPSIPFPEPVEPRTLMTESPGTDMDMPLPPDRTGDSQQQQPERKPNESAENNGQPHIQGDVNDDGSIINFEGDDDGHDASSITIKSRIEPGVLAASKLDDEKLFNAFKLKMERGAENGDTGKQIGSSKIAMSFIEYVSRLETRMERLEAELALTKRNSTGISKDNEEGGKRPEFKFETKFFSVADELDENGDFIDERNTMNGTFRSEVDPRHFMRVAWKRWQGNERKADDRDVDPQHPHPDSVEVFGLRIESKPIAKFLIDSLHYELRRGDLVELMRPFRALISHQSQIRKHFSNLENDLTKMRQDLASSQRVDPESAPMEEQGESETASMPIAHDGMRKVSVGDAPGEATGSFFATPLQEAEDPMTTIPTCRRDMSTTEAKVTETQEAVDHFKQLIQFMEEYLARDLAMYNQVKQATRSTISFENLWMLFEFQETIFCSGKKNEIHVDNSVNTKGFDRLITPSRAVPQAYRVLGCVNGLPTRKGVSQRKGRGEYPTKLNDSFTDKSVSDKYEVGDLDIRERFCPVEVYCFYIDWDAISYGTVLDCFTIRPFDGEIEITSLDAYPIRFLNNKPHRHGIKGLGDLVERGHKFIDMKNVKHMNYEGLTASFAKEEISSPVIVDMELAFQSREDMLPRYEPINAFWPRRAAFQVHQIPSPLCSHGKASRPCNKWRCMVDEEGVYQRDLVMKTTPAMLRSLDKYLPETLQKLDSFDELKKEFESARLMELLPGIVYDYALRDRKWIPMDITLLKPVVRNFGWKSLVLPRGHRQMVQAMVDTHAAGTRLQIEGVQEQTRAEVDLVRGKGKGCIILIHGAPGVGKTSTAECVAAYTNRPSFPITCGDIGYQPEEVEKRFDRVFNLAHKWGCVLLLDEADVFFAKRNKDDVKRNGLVSVFLRILEYYSGILFLTTNRVDAIDDAFRSRLHLTLYYPKLDAEKSLKIWKMNIKRIQNLSHERSEQGRAAIDIDKKRLVKFAADNFNLMQWNGRQIRNAFQTALALAEFETHKARRKKKTAEEESVVTISAKHFQTIALASREFDEYLQQTHGRTEENQAQYDRMRVEEFKDPGVRLALKVDETSSSSESDSSTSSSSSDSASEDSGASEMEQATSSRKKKKNIKKSESGKKSKSSSAEKSKKNKKSKKDSDAKNLKKKKVKGKPETDEESGSGSDSDDE